MISWRLSIRVLTLLAFFFPRPALASGPVNMVSTDVVVPSAGRGPGAAGSFWVTDLWVRCNDRTDVTLEFHALDAPSGTPTATVTLPMTQPVVYLADVMKNTFGLDSGFGNIRVHSSRPVAATIRVYSTGTGGSYGFASMGMPGSMSMGSPGGMMGNDDSHRHYMQGLLPQPQARVNVLIANTSPTLIQGTCDVLDSDGGIPASGPASFRFSIQPYSGHQFGNVLAGVHSRFGDAGLQLRIALDAGNGGTMMTLASVVDNETNDSYVLMGSMMDDHAPGMMSGN